MNAGLELSKKYFDQWGNFSSILPCYQSDSRTCIATRVVLAVPSAILKTFWFPVACAVAIVAFPIIAIAKCCGKTPHQFDDKYMTVTVFAVVGLFAVVGFGAAFAFCNRFTLKTALGVMATAFSISIAYHIKKAISPHAKQTPV